MAVWSDVTFGLLFMGSGSRTLSFFFGPSDGDVVVLMLRLSGGGTVDVTSPTDWTAADPSNASLYTGNTVQCFTRVYDGSEGPNIDIQPASAAPWFAFAQVLRPEGPVTLTASTLIEDNVNPVNASAYEDIDYWVRGVDADPAGGSGGVSVTPVSANVGTNFVADTVVDDENLGAVFPIGAATTSEFDVTRTGMDFPHSWVFDLSFGVAEAAEPPVLSTAAVIDHDLLFGVEPDDHHPEQHYLDERGHTGGWFYKSGSGSVTVSDSDFLSPTNGYVAVSYSTTTGMRLLWARSNGSWKAVEA